MTQEEFWSDLICRKYAYSVWNPYHIHAIKTLEQIQMKASILALK